MNTKTRRGLAAAGLIATTLTAVVAIGGPAQAVEWKRERGNVLECTGHKNGLEVRTTVYENSRYGNTVQVGIGDPESDNAGMRTTDTKFLVDGALRATVQVGGKRAVIKGTVERFGPRILVNESFDDGPYLVKNRGFQRKLRTVLVAKYDGAVVPLTCDPAFYYDLEVKRIPIN
jgi:hypothetical protein